MIARITEVLDPKGLRKGMNSPDTNREDQKANDLCGVGCAVVSIAAFQKSDDQLANFLFLH
jgi:hypothetical protein